MAGLGPQKVSFIGGGNMAAAIVSGLVAKGFDKKHITVSEPWHVNRQKMADLGVNTTANNTEAATGADIIILATKPQVAKTVCQELAATTFSSATSPPVMVSIAAGITIASLKEWCRTREGKSPAVVRVMPNTPALLGQGATGVYADGDVTAEQKKSATALLESVSKAIEWVETEELLDVVTGLSGSGPAYFFAMVEHLIASAVKLGLPEEQAARLAKQTCLGAGTMLKGDADPSQLRKNVTSPNGTTQAGLQSFEASDFAGIVHLAVEAATKRAGELGRTLGGQ